MEFPYDQLQLGAVRYEFTPEIEDEQDAEFELILEFQELMVGHQAIRPVMAFIGASNPEMEKQVFSEGYGFTEADDTLEPGTIYLESVHNPVDLKWLRIERLRDKRKITVELYFDFEYAGASFASKQLTLEFER